MLYSIFLLLIFKFKMSSIKSNEILSSNENYSKLQRTEISECFISLQGWSQLEINLQKRNRKITNYFEIQQYTYRKKKCQCTKKEAQWTLNSVNILLSISSQILEVEEEVILFLLIADPPPLLLMQRARGMSHNKKWMHLCVLSLLSVVRLFVIPWTVAH